MSDQYLPEEIKPEKYKELINKKLIGPSLKNIEQNLKIANLIQENN